MPVSPSCFIKERHSDQWRHICIKIYFTVTAGSSLSSLDKDAFGLLPCLTCKVICLLPKLNVCSLPALIYKRG